MISLLAILQIMASNMIYIRTFKLFTFGPLFFASLLFIASYKEGEFTWLYPWHISSFSIFLSFCFAFVFFFL